MNKVLIVANDPKFLKSIDQDLKKYTGQFEVVTASDGKEALKLLKREHISLLATELKVTKIDGLMLLAHISWNYSRVPCIVMTEYRIPVIKNEADKESNLFYIEKPVNSKQLADTILNGLDFIDEGGGLKRIPVSDFLYLIGMEKKSCLLQINLGDKRKGFFYFNKGVLYDALYADLIGKDAAFQMIALQNVQFSFKTAPKKKIYKRINTGLPDLIAKALNFKNSETIKAGEDITSGIKQKDDLMLVFDDKTNTKELDAASVSPGEQETGEVTQNINIIEGDKKMAEMTEMLEKFKDVDGFEAAGIFSANGEMVAEVNVSNFKLAELGALANDILLKAQKTTEIMGVGRGNMVHIAAPKAHVVARCLNEATDFEASSSGRAHIHMVLILSQDGNLAMGKMKLEAIIQEAAPSFR